MSARSYYGGVPAPPAHIKAEMFEGGRTNDRDRIDRAHGAYITWLAELGYHVPQGRPARADEAAR